MLGSFVVRTIAHCFASLGRAVQPAPSNNIETNGTGPDHQELAQATTQPAQNPEAPPRVGFKIKFPRVYDHERQMEGLLVYMEALSVNDAKEDQPFSCQPQGPGWSVGVMLEIKKQNLNQEISIAKILFKKVSAGPSNKRCRGKDTEDVRSRFAEWRRSKRRKIARIVPKPNKQYPFNIENLLAPRKRTREEESPENGANEVQPDGSDRKRAR
ncbi:hypothetical protein HDU67_002626, partial [Dinochytrium kinnereticum]